MKTLLIAFLVLSSASAHAMGPRPPRQAVAIPSTASLLFETAGTSFMTHSTEEAEAGAVDSAMASYMRDISPEGEIVKDVEFECKGIYRDWGSMLPERHGGSWNQPTYYSARITVNVYCNPRDYQEKVAISAERACEHEPRPQCMSDSYLKLFAKIKQTIYVDIGKP